MFNSTHEPALHKGTGKIIFYAVTFPPSWAGRKINYVLSETVFPFCLKPSAQFLHCEEK